LIWRRNLRGRGRDAAAGSDFEFDLKLPAHRDRHGILQQPQVIVLEPDFAEVVGHFKDDAVVFEGASPQRSKPEVVRVHAQH
jgi:hypothetical protein